MRPGHGSVPARSSPVSRWPSPAWSGHCGENRGGVGILGHERGHQLRCLIARELRDRSRRGGGLVLVRQSFVDVGHFPCLHSIQ